MADVKVISIGALAANPMWGEKSPVRTGHATTTLIRAGSATILIDPGLPPQAITARLTERANLKPEQITHVFITGFHPDMRRGISAFTKAQWLMSETERESLGVPLASRLRDEMSRDNADQELIAMLKTDVELLAKFQPAPDSLAEGVDLFPMPGVSPGTCGVLVPDQKHTTLITGDAIQTTEHLERGIMPSGAFDVRAAQESFKEAIEIADLMVLGRDNLVVNPTKRLF
jgi:glyoxylase-like metal-dependent hydrolase (beta-lactamase superfamily II)